MKLKTEYRDRLPLDTISLMLALGAVLSCLPLAAVIGWHIGAN